MESVQLEDSEDAVVEIHRSIPIKFMRELNHMHNGLVRKAKKNQVLGSIRPQVSFDREIELKCRSFGKEKDGQIQSIRNGNRIIAKWVNGQIQGETEIFYSNGVYFKGIYQNGIKVFGRFRFVNGFQYMGQCLGNKFNGEGTLYFPSGKIISGQWRGKEVVGNGKIEYYSGEVYYGQLFNLRKHGSGYMFFKDGSKYVGNFKHGGITGHGVYTSSSQEEIIQGEWKNGEFIFSEETIQMTFSEKIVPTDEIFSGEEIYSADMEEKNESECLTDQISY